MDRKTANKILKVLSKEYEEFDTELRYKKDWQLLAATLLSAQTTDANVNKVTPGLFKKYRTPRAIGNAKLSELEKDIFSTGYYKAKARNLKAMCQVLDKNFKGKVPDNMEDLVSLPGVGRKTANVVLHILHDKKEGIVFDTHIARVTHRLGFTDKKDPKKGEEVMMELIPKKDWKRWGDYLIQHGRKVCDARKPKCGECSLNKICDSAFSF